MGSASTVMLAYFGFYLVKNSLSRDRNTRVGEILASTPLTDYLYIASKFVSNLAVLTLMASALALAAVVMQLLLSPVEAGFDLWALLAPFRLFLLCRRSPWLPPPPSSSSRFRFLAAPWETSSISSSRKRLS